MNAQDFGCYNVPSDYPTGIYTKGNSSSFNFDQKDFKIANKKDGYYKEYYNESAYFPKKLKMEGNIFNAVPNGKWTLHFPNRSYFITGNYSNGKKEGLWKDYFINEVNDTVLISKMNFEKDTINGESIEYFDNGKISKIKNYRHGVKNGEEIEYLMNNQSKAYFIHKKSHYVSGLLEGECIEYHSNDTLEYELFSQDKRNGKCKYFSWDGKLVRVIDFKDDKLEGQYKKYYKNGKLAYEIECKNNLPFTAICANDINGNKLDIGSLINGTGTLMCYLDSGKLKSKAEFKDQWVFGSFINYYESGKVLEEGKIFCDKKKDYVRKESNIYIKDFNLFSINQQNFSKGTDYNAYGKDGKLIRKIVSIPYNTSITDTILYQEFNENGNVKYIGTEIYGLKTGVEKKYFESGQIEQVGEYAIVYKDSVLNSLKNGSFKYYHPNGIIKAEISYKDGNRYGKSFFYDDSGILKRVEEIKKNGEIINIFNGDTLNRIDSNGLKQGKWINFSRFYSTDNCQDKPREILYFKDNIPTGTWEYYNYNGTTLHQKYIWKDSVLAQYFQYDLHGGLIKEGYMLNEAIRTGQWKEYDFDKGYLKFKGEYYNGEKEGIWQEYRRNGKLKKEIRYIDGKINRAT